MTLTLPVQVSVSLGKAGPPVQFYRQPHDVELLNFNQGDSGRRYMGDGYRLGPVRDRAVETGKAIPEVYRALPSHSTKLSPAWQMFWRDLLYEFPDDILDSIIDDHLGWTNGTASIPAFDQSRLCGGALLRARAEGSYLHIDGLLTDQPVPDAKDVLNKPWLWYYAVQVNPRGQVTYINRTTKDGSRKPIRVPILSRLPLYVRADWLDPLPGGWDPAFYDPTDFG